ncbi:MAG: hypothetical protein D6B26_03640, partial [Spirochaetaceae bacterium]
MIEKTNHQKTIYVFLLSIVTMFLVLACGTGPGGRDVPEWVVQRPAPDADSYYFVGSGVADIQPEAEDIASRALIGEIVRFIGVEISSETTATARSSLDSYEAELEEQVRQKGQAVVSGFTIADSYVVQKDDEVIVYLLGKYDRGRLESEQQRFQDIFQMKQDAVDVPAARGERLFEQGRFGQALPFLFEAAAAAQVSSIENAEIKFDRSTSIARQIIESLAIEPQVLQVQVDLNTQLPEPIGIRVYATRQGTRFPVSDLPFQVTYRELRNQRMVVRTARLLSDEDGFVYFDLPPTNYSGKQEIVFRLDLYSAIEPLREGGDRYMSRVDALEEAASSVSVSIPLISVSGARSRSTVVLAADIDQTGAVIDGQSTAQGILAELTSAEFSLVEYAMPVDRLAGMSNSELLALMRSENENKPEQAIERVI